MMSIFIVLISCSTEFNRFDAYVDSHSSSLVRRNSMDVKSFISGVTSLLKQLIM